MRAYVVAVAGLMVLWGLVPAVAANAVDFVPRAEYNQLKQQFEQQQADYQELKAQVAQILAQQQRAGRTVRLPATGAESGFRFLPGGLLTPGWERYRPEGWMAPDHHSDNMEAKIAEVGDLKLYMGLDTVGRFQYLQQDDDTADTVGASSVEPMPLSAGFQTAYGNMSFLADFNDAVEVFFDIFIADAPHPSQLQGNEGYILVRNVPGSLGDIGWVEALFDKINVKAGEFEVDFGDAHYRRSTNAKVQRNPLIGNYAVDVRSTDIGVEVYSDPGTTPVNWLIGLGNGSDTQDFEDGRGWQVHAKLWGNPTEDLRTSASAMWVDHSDTTTSTRTNLFRSNRSGAPYAGVLDNSAAAGDVLLGAGQRQFAAQTDLTWTHGNNELYGHFGYFNDTDVNGSSAFSPRNTWLYYGAEATHHFTERLFGAARYSGASALRLTSRTNSAVDVNSDGLVHRLQIGGGYWLTPTILAKLEYVHQLYTGFSSDGAQVSGVDVWGRPDFNGLISEVSFAF